MIAEQPYRLGFGTYSLTGTEGAKLITEAIEMGYRHIDTARLYENEANVGDAIDASSLDRDELFVATKVGHFEEPEKTPNYIKTAVDESLDRLGVNSIDLIYHHWPRRPVEIDMVLPVLEELHKRGVVERIGVSNYRIEDIKRTGELVDVSLFANQVEMHPLLQQEELYEFCRERDIAVVAYAPVAQGRVFDVPEIVDIADKQDTTPAVVSLSWLLAHEGVAPIPRSSTLSHMKENLTARDLELDAEDLERIDAIERTHRSEDPKWMEW